jgi:putative transposase
MGKGMFLWRALDEEGEVLDGLALKRRNKQVAARGLSKLLKHQGVRPKAIVTDKLGSYGAAAKEPGLLDRHQPTGQAANNRAENAYLPFRQRERKRQRFKSHGSAPLFLSIYATVYDTFNLPPHLISRTELGILRAQAQEAWANATATA